MLNDDIGSALALNRLAVVFFKRKKYDLSYMYHGKHAQQADDNDKFVAIYNSGISSRLLGEYHRAASEFHEALNISTPRNVSDTNFLTLLTFCGNVCNCAGLRVDVPLLRSTGYSKSTEGRDRAGAGRLRRVHQDCQGAEGREDAA